MDILELEDNYLKENVGSAIAMDTQLPATKAHFNAMYENYHFSRIDTDAQIVIIKPWISFILNISWQI